MSTTVAVAIVTATSTLLGATISAGIAYLINHAQNKLQGELARRQRMDERSDAHRQIRREAYVKFLNQVSEIQQMLDSCWTFSSPVPRICHTHIGKLCGEVKYALGKLTSPLNLVILEGPRSVANPSMKLKLRLTLELTQILYLSAAANTPDDWPLCTKNEKVFKETQANKGNIMQELVDAARRALDIEPEVKATIGIRASKAGEGSGAR